MGFCFHEEALTGLHGSPGSYMVPKGGRAGIQLSV